MTTHHKRRTKYKFPDTRLGWYAFYAEQFNLHGREQAAQLAMWYYLLHLAFDQPQDPPTTCSDPTPAP